MDVPQLLGHVRPQSFGPVCYPTPVYAALAAAVLASLIGRIRWLALGGLRCRWQRHLFLAAASLGLLVIASFIRFNLEFFQAQGRYLFPALPLWASLLVLGLEQLVPPRARPALHSCLLLCMAVLAACGLMVMRNLHP